MINSVWLEDAHTLNMSPFIYYFWLDEDKTQAFLDKEYSCGNGGTKLVFCSCFLNLTHKNLEILREVQI